MTLSLRGEVVSCLTLQLHLLLCASKASICSGSGTYYIKVMLIIRSTLPSIVRPTKGLGHAHPKLKIGAFVKSVSACEHAPLLYK